MPVAGKCGVYILEGGGGEPKECPLREGLTTYLIHHTCVFCGHLCEAGLIIDIRAGTLTHHYDPTMQTLTL